VASDDVSLESGEPDGLQPALNAMGDRSHE
jgi:hypothetical protein